MYPSRIKYNWSYVLLLCACSVKLCNAQEENCYGAGSIAASVILTVIFTILLLIGAVFAWKRYKVKTDHLIIETDPEKGKGEYAFDNPGFKESSILAIPKAVEKNSKVESKIKWNQWSPLTALSLKNEKRKTLDDSALEENEVKVVALRSHDFTGLGFNIEGNMKEGIFIKDILHRGPAFESGKLNPGDRINSVSISFEHMVYEDALTILSYASPYEVIIEAKSGRLIHHTSGQGAQPSHPVYRSSSCTDLFQMEKSSKKRLFGDDYTGSMSSSYSSLQKSRSNMTTLERKESKSPRMRGKKINVRNFSPEQLKLQLEQKISLEHQNNVKQNLKTQKVDVEMQKSENLHQKLGIKVLPVELQVSPKTSENLQNDNNINIEKHSTDSYIEGVDEVDETKKPLVKKREKKLDVTPETLEEHFVREGSLNSSGIKRDKNGIPQEIPSQLLNAAVVARRNRKNSVDNNIDEDEKTNKKSKGKAPSPPCSEENGDKKDGYDEIKLMQDIDVKTAELQTPDESSERNVDVSSDKIYHSDSDTEADNHSSVNTIELNSSDITIHQTEEEARESRKTVSTGDLTKIKKTRKNSTGTLERAQSLDITDTGIPGSLKRKGGSIEDMTSDEDIFGKAMINKEPRLSLILDGLNTFQRNRLKKSTEWGNLEDAILKLNREDENEPVDPDSNDNSLLNLGDEAPEVSALIDKILQIKKESIPIEVSTESIERYTGEAVDKQNRDKNMSKVKNQIWPTEDELKSSSNILDSVNIPQNGKTEGAYQVEIVSNHKSSNGVEQTEKPTFERRQKIPTTKNYILNYPPQKTTLNTDTNSIILNYEETQQNPRNNVDKNEFNTEDKIENNILEKRQIKPLRVLTEMQLGANKNKISITDEDLKKFKEDSDVQVTELLENEQMPTETMETVHPPEIQRRQRQPPTCNKRNVSPTSDINNTDEIKTISHSTFNHNLFDVTKDFLSTEKLFCSTDQNVQIIHPDDINISDDIKVSRHSHCSLESSKTEDSLIKSDDMKSNNGGSLNNISNIEISSTHENGNSSLHSLELSINEKSDLYTTALDNTTREELGKRPDVSGVTISTPDIIGNATLTEAIKTLNNDVTISGPASLTLDISQEYTGNTTMELNKNMSNTINTDPTENNSDFNNATPTYVTEIQVLTPNQTSNNISEVEILQKKPKENGKNLDNEFENYVKSFESRVEADEAIIPNFESNMEEFIINEPKSIIINDKIDPEKELHKIQEIAEEQLKKLPEMRFSTSSYESKIPEKRQSQIELLRSNFEKTPPKPNKTDSVPKSRIPISTVTKTPPMSPERRDSRNLDNENDKALLELMSSSIHSTPIVSHSRYQSKSPSRNVTVTSIRTNSKIPSGLPTYTNSSRPPIPPKRTESIEGENTVKVSTNGNVESSFKQWVFHPSSNPVTNIAVQENKEK